jgi:hypothetical protein
VNTIMADECCAASSTPKPLEPQPLLTFIADHRGNSIGQDLLAKLQAVVDSIMPPTPSTSVSFPSMR